MFIQSLSQEGIDSHAATLLSDGQVDESVLKRSISLKNLIKKCDQLSFKENDIFHELLGNTLTYTPSVNIQTGKTLKEHVTRAHIFVQRFSSPENLIWSVIKGIVIEVPGTTLDEIDSTFVNLPLVRTSDMRSRNFVQSILDTSHTLLHVCDERKMDGDIRRLLKDSLFVNNLSTRPSEYRMYTVVISRTSERVAIEDIENLKKRLRKAKQIELDSIFSGAFLMRRDHSDRSASIVHGNSVDILTLVGADAAKEMSNIVKALGPHLCHCQRVAKYEHERLERFVTIICDNLESGLESPNVTMGNCTERRNYFNHQILTTLAYARSNKDTEVPEFNPSSDWTEWFHRLFACVETQMAQSMENFKHGLNGALHEACRMGSVENLIAFREHSLEISDRKRKRQHSAYSFDFEECDAFRLLSSYVHAATRHELSHRIWSDLKSLNKVILTKFRSHLLYQLCYAGAHRHSKAVLRRSIWFFARHCEQSFNTLVTREWIYNILGNYSVHSFHEALNAELNSNQSETSQVSETMRRVLESVHNDVALIFTSRLRAIQYVYHLGTYHLFGISNVVSSSRESITHSRLSMSLHFPLYHRTSEKSCITWELVSLNCATNSTTTQKATPGDRVGRALGLSCDKFMQVSTPRETVKSKFDLSSATYHLNRVVIDALQFIERESSRRNTFFRVWGSDLLATFYFFREISTGIVRETTDAILHRFSALWLMQNASIDGIYSIEDFLFYNEGYYVLRRLGYEHDRLWGLIRQSAVKLNTALTDYLGLKGDDNTHHGGIKFDELSTAMVWSFFLSGNDLGIPGTNAMKVDALLATRGALILPVRSLRIILLSFEPSVDEIFNCETFSRYMLLRHSPNIYSKCMVSVFIDPR